MLPDPVVTVLGRDPPLRTCVLNGNAFQQDVLVSLNGWQYAAFYSPKKQPLAEEEEKDEPVFVNVGRRKLPDGPWEVLILEDYEQTVDDGHNTVQMGVCAGDGTIHLSFDHHCDVLRYRHSVANLATNPSDFEWAASLFKPTQAHLPGLPSSHPHFGYVTYPRFGPIGHGDMFLSFRTGKAGLGDDHLYIYRSSSSEFSFVGTHLTGVANNPYVHGMDFRHGKLHLTWVYRGFVEYPGWDDPLDTKHKQQAGPNSAYNNHDLCYAFSDDEGYTWRNNQGEIIAHLAGKGGTAVPETVKPDAPGLVVFPIPRGSGLTNQESQVADHEGGVHVLNRFYYEGNLLTWIHFYRDPSTGNFDLRPICPVPESGKRGRLAVTKTGDLLALLPDAGASTLKILRARRKDDFRGFEELWHGNVPPGEPLVDTSRLDDNGDGVLSVFVRRKHADQDHVVVMDFTVEEE